MPPSNEIFLLLHVYAECSVRHKIEEAMGWPTPTRHPPAYDPHHVDAKAYPDLLKIKQSHLQIYKNSYRIVLRKRHRRIPHYVMDFRRTFYFDQYWKKDPATGQWKFNPVSQFHWLIRDDLHTNGNDSPFKAYYYYHPGNMGGVPIYTTQSHFREKILQSPSLHTWYKTIIDPETGTWETMQTPQFWLEPFDATPPIKSG